MLVVQDREQPSPKIGPFLPKVKFPEGTGEALLDEILRGRDIARQNPRIARQPRNQGFDLLVKVVIDSIP